MILHQEQVNQKEDLQVRAREVQSRDEREAGLPDQGRAAKT